MYLNKGAHPKPDKQMQKYSGRTSDYLAGSGSPERVAVRIKKEERRAADEAHVQRAIANAVYSSSTREEAAEALSGRFGMPAGKILDGLTEKMFYGLKSAQPQAPEIDLKFLAETVKTIVANGGKVAAAVMLPLASYILIEAAKEPGWGAAAESGDGHGRAADSWSGLAQAYQNVQAEINSALADGQLSVQERGQLQQDVQAIQAAQTQGLLNYLSWLGENQTREGQNISVVSSVANRGITDPPPTEPKSIAFYNLRDKILPARDKNLQDAGVDKAAAANMSPVNRLYQSMNEIAKAHEKNDAAVQKMDQTKTTVGPSEVSDIGTSPEKTTAQLLKLMKQMQNPDADKNSLMEKLNDWLESPDTWDFVNGVWKTNQVQVLQAVKDFYSGKIAPAPYYTAVSDWAPAAKPINHDPVIDGPSVSTEGSLKYGYHPKLNASDIDNDTLAFELTRAPGGAAINPQTGEINWQPAENQIGLNDFSAKVSDGKGGVKEYSWQVNVTKGNNVPAVERISIATTGSVKYGYETFVNITDIDAGDSQNLTLKENPLGAIVEKVGPKSWKIKWSPTQTGEYNFRIGVSDGWDEIYYGWKARIDSGNHAPVISSEGILKIAQTRHAYEQRILAGDIDVGDILKFNLIEGPSGMKINPDTGMINWTPNRTQAGIHNVTVEVTDGETLTRLSYQVKVSSDNSAPKILNQPETLVKVGGVWQHRAQAKDNDIDPLVYELEINGFRANNTNGNFSWTPEKKDTGERPYTIRVKDPYGGVAEQTGKINIISNNPPQAPTVQKIFLEKGGTAKVSLRGIDPDGDKLNYRVSAPAGVNATIDENGNLILKGLKKGSGELEVSLSDGADSIAFKVPYEVKNKIITPNMMPYYLAAGALIAGVGVPAGLYGAHRAERRKPADVRGFYALDGAGRLIGAWNEKGAEKKGKGDDIFGGMLTAVKSFVEDGTKGGAMNLIEYVFKELPGKPKYKFLIAGGENVSLVAIVGTEKPKRLKRIQTAMEKALIGSESSLSRGWDGNIDSPVAAGVRFAVSANIYGKEPTFKEWLGELFGASTDAKKYSPPKKSEVDPLLASIPTSLGPRPPASATFAKSSGSAPALLAREGSGDEILAGGKVIDIVPPKKLEPHRHRPTAEKIDPEDFQDKFSTKNSAPATPPPKIAYAPAPKIIAAASPPALQRIPPTTPAQKPAPNKNELRQKTLGIIERGEETLRKEKDPAKAAKMRASIERVRASFKEKFGEELPRAARKDEHVGDTVARLLAMKVDPNQPRKREDPYS